MALAHAVGNKVEAAYRRGDLLAKRQQLMQDWADYALGRRAGNMTDGHSSDPLASTRDNTTDPHNNTGGNAMKTISPPNGNSAWTSSATWGQGRIGKAKVVLAWYGLAVLVMAPVALLIPDVGTGTAPCHEGPALLCRQQQSFDEIVGAKDVTNQALLEKFRHQPDMQDASSPATPTCSEMRRHGDQKKCARSLAGNAVR